MHHFLLKILQQIWFFIIKWRIHPNNDILKNYDIFIRSNLSNIEFHTNILVIDFSFMNQVHDDVYSNIIPQYFKLFFFWIIGVETDFL